MPQYAQAWCLCRLATHRRSGRATHCIQPIVLSTIPPQLQREHILSAKRIVHNCKPATGLVSCASWSHQMQVCCAMAEQRQGQPPFHREITQSASLHVKPLCGRTRPAILCQVPSSTQQLQVRQAIHLQDSSASHTLFYTAVLDINQIGSFKAQEQLSTGLMGFNTYKRLPLASSKSQIKRLMRCWVLSTACTPCKLAASSSVTLLSCSCISLHLLAPHQTQPFLTSSNLNLRVQGLHEISQVSGPDKQTQHKLHPVPTTAPCKFFGFSLS